MPCVCGGVCFAICNREVDRCGCQNSPIFSATDVCLAELHLIRYGSGVFHLRVAELVAVAQYNANEIVGEIQGQK